MLIKNEILNLVAIAMVVPLVYDMVKGYNLVRDGKAPNAQQPPSTKGLSRTLMAFGIIIVLAIMIFHVMITITYNVLPISITNSLVETVKSIATILGGAVSAIIGF